MNIILLEVSIIQRRGFSIRIYSCIVRNSLKIWEENYLMQCLLIMTTPTYDHVLIFCWLPFLTNYLQCMCLLKIKRYMEHNFKIHWWLTMRISTSFSIDTNILTRDILQNPKTNFIHLIFDLIKRNVSLMIHDYKRYLINY